MKVPNKIFICKYGSELGYEWHPESEIEKGNNDIEYVRKDVFVEKACDAYCRRCDTKECVNIGDCDWVEKFRKHLMKLL